MFSRQGSFAGRHKATRLLVSLSLIAAFGAVACGVPLTDAEVSATAKAAPTTESLASSLAAGAATLDRAATLPPAGTPTPFGTVAPLASPTAQASPSAVATGSPTAPPTETAIPSPTTTPLPPAVSDAEYESQVLLLLNAERQKRGLTTLKFSSSLTAEARGFARLMAENNYWNANHVGPDGSTPVSRFNASGYPGFFQGEAIAAGYASAAALMDGWLTSPAHAAILLSSKAVDVGIGHYQLAGTTWTHFWVLVTASP